MGHRIQHSSIALQPRMTTIWLGSGIAQELLEQAEEWGPLETGGLLLGWRSPGTSASHHRSGTSRPPYQNHIRARSCMTNRTNRPTLCGLGPAAGLPRGLAQSPRRHASPKPAGHSNTAHHCRSPLSTLPGPHHDRHRPTPHQPLDCRSTHTHAQPVRQESVPTTTSP